ncbi:MAG: heavy-metal-associated domain-containing protein [Saprospiraceae bacterium]|nr:heavy-metal-associated domain-containing protein [Saprospiraceae bacterium]
MKKIKFKTNINCGGCVRSVSGFLNEVEGISKWEVDTDNPDKTLTVEGREFQEKSVVEAVEEAGFVIEPIEG